MAILGCIGDDFTGSSDLANTLSKMGMRTTQFVGIPPSRSKVECDAAIVSLKSRSLPVSEAVAQSLAALKWLQAQGCSQYFFKYCSTFDSTPVGNIGPVTVALADALQAPRVFFCPALPSNGRSVYMGHLFVDDVLLSESGMEKHPVTPMPDPDLRRWLERQVSEPVGHVDARTVSNGPTAILKSLDRKSVSKTRLFILDTITDEHLMTIGSAVKDFILVTGGSGIALGLPGNFGFVPRKVPWDGINGPALILSGSCSAATRLQVAEHTRSNRASRKLNIGDLVQGKLSAKSFAQWCVDQETIPLIYSTADPAEVATVQAEFGAELCAKAIEEFFGEVAFHAVKGGVTRLIVAGGETAGAVTTRLKLKELTIGPEIEPGIPALRARENLAIVLKSGNFGSEAFFNKAAESLISTQI